jgi:N-acetylmuramoyl-L-alanine amidase
MHRIYLLLILLCGCTTIPKNEPHQAMRHALFASPGVRGDKLVRPLIGPALEDFHAVEWLHFQGSLHGVRIALDPGHIGGEPWDDRNGKYVTMGDGQRLSEGLMAWELAQLLAKDLRALGAEVYIDRELAPVTAHIYDDFAGDPEVFFRRLDLDARRERLWAFRPDITLILHFDAHAIDASHRTDWCHDTKAYVPGAFTSTDFKDDADRAFFKVIWNNPKVWMDSFDLSRSLVQQIHAQLGADLGTEEIGGSKLIEPGLFARNLRLQRHMAGFVTSYVETLCYEDPDEFKALSQADFKMRIGDKTFSYSKRLMQLSSALRDGIVAFVKSR